MNLEQLFSEKSVFSNAPYPLKPIQVPLFYVTDLSPHRVSSAKIERILKEISNRGLCGQAQVADYLRSKLRCNCRPNTIRTNSTAILLFLAFLKKSGHQRLSTMSREQISAFVEHEQDRGLAPISIDGRLKALYTFLNYLVEHDIIAPDVLKHKLRIKVPDALPRAIDPEDIKQLLCVLKKPRDQAMMLTLLRTGMRIGELLSTEVTDLNLKEQNLQIVEAEKNRVGRVVYLSSDAAEALKKWLSLRDRQCKFLFCGRYGRPLGYEAARGMFKVCLNKAGLAHKGYTLHCLRHTFASELLNAGMPLQCLQELLGHKSIEMTRRYARLTDNTRRQAYYEAMAIIEKGEINGHYRLDYQLP